MGGNSRAPRRFFAEDGAPTCSLFIQAGTFSLPSVYRFLAEHGLDSRAIKRQPQLTLPQSAGPTKAFECALANELWMTDMMFGPSLHLATGPVLHTRLFESRTEGGKQR